MGWTSKGKGSVEAQSNWLAEADLGRAPNKPFMMADSSQGLAWNHRPPDQTNSKSKLIAEYIALFQKVTKGGLFIDGFSAPQSRNHEDAWTARRVLEVEPKRLRRFWLCDMDASGLLQLQRLKSLHDQKPSWRHVHVMSGDFNRTIDTILVTGRITPKSAVFAFLDQRNMECEWATVKKIAEFRTRRKVEMMYFLGTGWLMRAIKSSTQPDQLAKIGRWWGNDGWQKTLDVNLYDFAQIFASRFEHELGYRHVNAWPILMKAGEKKVAFFLIHASDHPQAPVLMGRAYRKICGDIRRSPIDSQIKLFDQK